MVGGYYGDTFASDAPVIFPVVMLPSSGAVGITGQSELFPSPVCLNPVGLNIPQALPITFGLFGSIPQPGSFGMNCFGPGASATGFPK